MADISALGWGRKDQEVQYQGSPERAEDPARDLTVLACDGGLGVEKGI